MPTDFITIPETLTRSDSPTRACRCALSPMRRNSKPEADGPAPCDIVGSKRTALPPTSHGRPERWLPRFDLDRGIVLPRLVDVHTHIDKGHIWPRAQNPNGTHLGARNAVMADREANWSRDDVAKRMDFALRCAFAHGTGALRTHIDSYPGFGGSSHVALLKLARAAQIEPGSLTIVPFKGANESVTALLGRHIDVSIATMSVIAPFLVSGELRAIAIAAPKRLSGSQSVIPTWRELGFDVVEGNWRGVVGPKNLGEAEVVFWSEKLSEVVKTDAWMANLKRNFWDADFGDSAASKRFLDTQYEEMRSTFAAVHLVK